ncbi:hypothetical protein M408DRAFT_252539 [Serendipita vermifera MAFF 305830]|uniref:PNPLA domain-containing protein n=1 Tax=Serendipita vermifera MAFF 305830 TaxID=933852 RepID=A0A0C3AWN5_SERVB|nr:hypothetical protein M408DRAFT_252539 [Serendipita vermifera MAFF 305830]
MPPVSPNSLTVSNPSHVSRPPTTGPVRILTLDGAPGGALRGLAQIKIVRALMKEVWKREHPNQDLVESEIDAMRPCDHFNMIFGSGTGGTIAVLLGRLNLTIKECEDHYKAIGDEVYANPFSNWNPRQRYNYDHERLERILKEESKPFASEEGVVRFGHQSERSPSCKAAVLTKMAHSIQSVHVLKSYEAEAGEVWEVIRATTASYYDFPNIKVNRLVLLGPDSGFNNPAEKAWNEAVRLYPQRVRGVWFISIGSGVHHENKLHPPVKEALPWENKLLAGMIREFKHGRATAGSLFGV